ncbi:MAG: LPS-assembly protein LptD [Methylovulum sp.]|jgi:LPS-assembly protein|nr:LPS-assembly protein LptD [Methylovulum sp.]MCF7998614.1 LPS-assembly protein LptD [Methylovulum sp.]MCF8006326.1 LPS-assembly protein LptD [Methylovulum sp.]
MFRRIFLVFLPSLTASSVSFADTDAWSCQQNQDNNQWICIGDQATPLHHQQAVEATAIEQTPKAIDNRAPLIKPHVPNEQATEATTAPPINAPQTPAPPSVRPSEASTCQDCSESPSADDDTGNVNLRLLGPVFNPQQEQIFSRLKARLPSDPWQNCLSPRGTQRHWIAPKDTRTQSPLDVKANYSEIFDNEIGAYSGKVELSRGDQRGQANNANYDSISETLDLQGDVYYSEDELALHSDTATLKLASDQAKLRDTLFIFPATPIRGSAATIYRDNKFLSHYQDVTYTSCRPGNQDWALHASELKLNKQTGKGSAKNTWIEFKGVPVFYSPYMAFPVDSRRLSGFLSPSFGSTQNGGFIPSAPYYWNIAPNYDAVITPKYFTKRGALLGGDFRYLSEQSQGTISMEYMPDDQVLNDSRYMGSLKHFTQFTPNISGHLDLNTVSDKNYFAELGNALSFPNFSFVKSQADINYLSDGIAFTTRVESYQTIDPTLSALQMPYRRLPQINLNLNRSFNLATPVDTALESESVYFQHNGLVNGQRFNLKPSISLPIQNASGYITPKLSLQHTQYLLNNQNNGQANDISRTLPIMSVDSGLFVERDLTLANTAMRHTIEPRLFYLYIPKTDQSQIPLFDTSVYDFWYSSMFRENRFSGSDRIQDANQVTTAVTTRLLDPSNGRERLKLSIGEIFYFRNRDVTLCGNYPTNLCAISPVETADSSPLVSELSSQLTEQISIDSGLQWDSQTNHIVRGKAGIHYVNPQGQIVNVGYLYRQNPLIPNRSNDITQSDMSFRWPIVDNWHAVGRWQYSWLYNSTQDMFFGVEKENCCWRFRLIGRSYLNSLNQITDNNQLLNNSIEGTMQTGVFFQVELKGLTGIGEKLDNFFEKSIYGYRKPDK